MGNSDETLIEKTEKTIEGIVFAFGAYFRTLAALALPFFVAPLLRLHRLRKRKLLAPPLLFLSISVFLFLIALSIIDSPDKFVDTRTALSSLKDQANFDVSITHLLFNIFPIFLWALLLARTGRLMVAIKRRQQQLFSYFCYIFGFFGAGFFFWFLTNCLLVFDFSRHEERVEISWALPVSVGILMCVVGGSFFICAITVWTLTRSEVIPRRFLKSSLSLVLLAAMIVGSFFIQFGSRRFNEAIAKPAKVTEPPPPTFDNWRQGRAVSFDGKDQFLIKFRIVATNPRDTTVFVNRNMRLFLAGEGIDLDCGGDLTQSRDPLTLPAKQSSLINCQGQLEKSRSQNISGRRVQFSILATWYDRNKDGLNGHTDWVTDIRDHNLDIDQLTEPTPTPEKGKKIR
jgi:hypothetical protein